MLYDKTSALVQQFLSGRTLTRWRTRFRNLAEKHMGGIVKFLLNIHPEINVRINIGPSAFKYLLKLIGQLKMTNNIDILIMLLELQNAGSL